MTGIAYHSTVIPNRPHDYIYDQTFTVSSLKDHVKELSRSQAQNIIINPNFTNMFSELHHYPPAAFSLKPNHLPIGVGNDRSTVTEFLEVSGMARCKYFSRPVMPYKNVLSGQVIYAKQPEVEVTNKEVVDIDKVKETRTIGIQSTYRISETQTDPYSPAYIYDSALPVPELVGLSSLVYGKGLPAGKAEVEMIERARIKKEWEANLPPATDPKSYEKRLEMMEEMEMREWKDRDLEIKRVQEERLKVLETVIRQREQKNSVENEKREDRALQKKMQEKDFFMDKINQKRIKGIRKLQEARAKVDKRSLKRDIISDYVNYTSRVYSPKARDGLRKANAETTVKVKLEELSDYKGLENFQSKLDMSFMEASPGLPLQDTTSITYRKQQFLKNQLDIMSAKVNLTKERQAKSTALTPKVVLKTEVVVKSPIEQFQAVHDNNDEELEGAAIKLQSLIRGRAVQEQMFAERKARQDQIDELREKTRLRLTGDIEDLQRTTSILQEDKNEAEIRFEGTIQAEYVGKTLDYLTKHLIRLREERRMAAMIKLAERTRRMREAEESGQRQVELIRQQQHDLVFSQIVAVNRESVDSFLEEIISESIAYKAEEEAHEQAKESYKHRLELELESHEDEEQVLNDLVSSFVLPFVENITTRNLGERNGRPYARAAQQAIAEVLPDLERVEVETKQEELVDLPPLPKLQ